MNHFKDRKPSRPDIQEILSRMKSRFISEGNSDNEDQANGENMVTTSVIENTVEEIPVEKTPDDEIAELMLKLNGQVDEELVASIRSRKKMYENQSEVDSTSSTTYNSCETEQEKPRIILTLRPNENNPDSYVSSSNLTDFNSNSPKKKKQITDVKTEVIPLKRSSRRSNDRNESVLKSAIARKERTFNIDENSRKRLPKKIKTEPAKVTNEVDITHFITHAPIEDEKNNFKDIKIKEERNEESFTDQKKKKKKFFRGGRYNIFKKKSLQKNAKKAICNQLNLDSGHFEVCSSETNSEKHSVSVCSDVGTSVSSDRNYQDDMDISLSTTGVEDKIDDNIHSGEQVKQTNLCLCNEHIEVVIVDEGKITCKAEDCIDGKLVTCRGLAYNLNKCGNMPMIRANVTLPFLTLCEHHIRRFFLHHSCPRCGRFCSEGIFMMCKNKHFSHIGCHQKDKGCLHCGVDDVYDLELRRSINNSTKILCKKEYKPSITVEIGNIKLTNHNCPPEIDFSELSKHLLFLKDEIHNTKRSMCSVMGLYQACETNDINKALSILGSECNLEYKFPSNHERTALHAACIHGNLMLVYLLLQAGVDPNLTDSKMKTPMRMASKFGHSNVVQCLMNFNGNPEIKDAQGMTALHLAAKNGKLNCCKVILNEHPSMVNWKDKGGWTPLVWACENGYIDVVEFFITHEPNTRIPDDENNVALHWAAISGSLEVVKCVVEYDSEVNMFNDAGDTALHIAARKNAVDIVSYLLEKGATAWHKNKGKKRPIDYCDLNTECYNILKYITTQQRKSDTALKPLITIKLEQAEPELEVTQTPIIMKTTPVIISDDITHGCEDVPIRCVNEIDDDVPDEFTYIKENCYDVGNYVDSAMSHIASCNCEGACNTSDCKCVQANGDCLYDENGRLNSDFDYFNPSVILYECNLRCRCHKQRCCNRVIQKGIKIELELFKHKDMGWGVRTLQAITRGTFVCEYVGEIITDQKANDLKEDSYLFNLENPGAAELFCIDAYNYSNVSRFINHSCDPNLMSVRSFINHHDKRFPRIAFFAVQDINEYEQLSYDYGTTFWKIKGGLFTCKCGKADCSFSNTTIKSLDIDSDKEETEWGGDIENIKFSNDNLSNENLAATNKTDSSSLHHKTNLLKGNDILKLKKEYTSSSINKTSSISVNDIQRNDVKESIMESCIPQNGVILKNKSHNLNVLKTKRKLSKELLKIADDCSAKILGSKLIQNKLQQVMLNKMLDKQILNGNFSLAIGKKVLVTRKKSSIEIAEQDKNWNDNKAMSSGSVKLTNNKSITTYVLRPKKLDSNKKVTNDIETKNSVTNDIVLNVSNLESNKDVTMSSDTSCSDQITLQDSKSCDQPINSIKTEHVNEESVTKLNIVNGEHINLIECIEKLCTSERKYDEIKTDTDLYTKTNDHSEDIPDNDKDC